MRIVKEGKLPQEQTFRTTCRNCNTEFEFKKRESTIVGDQREGDYMTVVCPLAGCGTAAYVQLPSR